MNIVTAGRATEPGTPGQRRASIADLPAMWEIRTAAMRTTCASHYPPDVLETMAASPPPSSMPSLIEAGGAFVAESGGAIAGYAILDIATGEVDAVFVDPKWQGRGIARQLLATVEATAVKGGLGRLFLSSSLNAVDFYKSAGFAVVREEMYPHRSGIGIPSVLMEKQLAHDEPPMQERQAPE